MVADIGLRSVTSAKLEDIEKHFKTAEAWEIPESPADALRAHMQTVVDAIRASTKRQTVVVAVDNLDRCRPDAALRFIESLLVFNEVRNLRLIVAADRAALIGFVNSQFAGAGFDGALYLEKIFPYTISIPEAKGEGQLLQKLTESISNTALSAFKKDIWVLLHQASTTRNPRRAKRILRRLERLQQVSSPLDLYVIIMGVTLAETWPALYTWFRVCSQHDWALMLPEVQESGSGVRPACATDQSQEFLRAIARCFPKQTPTFNNVADLRRMLSPHFSVLDI